MEWLYVHWIGLTAIVLAVIRFVESIFQWYNTQETKNVIQALWDIIINFLFKIETYSKEKK